MRSTMKKALAVLLAVVLILSITACGVTRSGTDSEKRAQKDNDRFLLNQDQSNVSYDRMLHKFADDGDAQLLAYYPDYYAGAYINDEGNLVILTKNAKVTDIEYSKKICDNERILYKEAEYSYNELFSIKDRERDMLNEMRKSGSVGDFSLEIRDNENMIYIGINDMYDEAVKTSIMSCSRNAKEFSGKDCISIFQSAVLEQCGTLYPGSLIDSTEQGSVGFKASYTSGSTTKTGFITAGHVTLGSSSVYDSGNILTHKKIGDVITCKIENYYDASFVETNSSFPISNTVDGCTILAGTILVPAVGSKVYMCGYKSGIQEGFTISHVYEGWFSGKYLSFMVKTGCYCVQGDSGGLLYTKSGSTAKVFGILTARDTDLTGKFLCSYFTNASLLPWNITVIN